MRTERIQWRPGALDGLDQGWDPRRPRAEFHLVPSAACSLAGRMVILGRLSATSAWLARHSVATSQRLGAHAVVRSGSVRSREVPSYADSRECEMTVQAGEDIQDIGRDGLHSAKNWLDRTTRVQSSWTHQDHPMAELLSFRWPHASTPFSFDIGGRFRGEDLDNKSFLAEVKNYKNESNLPMHYRDFLAKCYVAYLAKPIRCDNFLWISWSPFQAKAWDKHVSVDRVKASILHKENCQRVVGTSDPQVGATLLDPEALVAVANRIWLVTLSSKQEQLVLTREHYVEVIRLITQKAV